MSTIIGIFICARKGHKMQSVHSATITANSGIEGDRYAIQNGVFSKAKQNLGHISLIAIEAIESANAVVLQPFNPADTRRNLITQGVDLNSLVSKEFLIGSIIVRGTELANPCNRPSRLSRKEGFKDAFANRGGLRAQVLSSGPIFIGDRITTKL